MKGEGTGLRGEGAEMGAWTTATPGVPGPWGALHRADPVTSTGAHPRAPPARALGQRPRSPVCPSTSSTHPTFWVPDTRPPPVLRSGPAGLAGPRKGCRAHEARGAAVLWAGPQRRPHSHLGSPGRSLRPGSCRKSPAWPRRPPVRIPASRQPQGGGSRAESGFRDGTGTTVGRMSLGPWCRQ